MEPTINFLDTYVMIAIVEEITPEASFFHDRYFATTDRDIFDSDKVLVEYKKGGRTMAPFVSPRAGDIPIDRDGYSVSEFEPPFVAPSRMLTVDELRKRGFGEALYANTQPAQRAARIQRQDLADLDKTIRRREEWMCAKTMLDNACTMQEYTDGHTKGQKLYIKFFDAKTEHTYTTAHKWDSQEANIREDVIAMCDMLTSRNLPAEDLLLGTNAYKAFFHDPEIRELIKTYSGINAGTINEQRTRYPGVVYGGRINFEGYWLDVYGISETYEDWETKKVLPLFPADGAMVTAPNCGHMAYARITQMDNPFSQEYTDHTGTRVPKLVVDQPNDIRKVRLAARPLAMPNNYTPWIFAAGVVNLDP